MMIFDDFLRPESSFILCRSLPGGSPTTATQHASPATGRPWWQLGRWWKPSWRRQRRRAGQRRPQRGARRRQADPEQARGPADDSDVVVMLLLDGSDIRVIPS